MGRSPCCSKVGLHRGPWSTREDTLLTDYIKAHGEGQWRSLPAKAGLLRCGKSCRLRWMNYLRPGIKRGNITPEEDDLIIRLHGLLGNRWSLIAGRLPGRTDNEIKNYWNTHLRKRLKNEGKEPIPKKSTEKRTQEPSKRAKATTKEKMKKKKKKKDKKSADGCSDGHSSTETKICPPNSNQEEVPTEVMDFSWPLFELEDGGSIDNNGDLVCDEEQDLFYDCDLRLQCSVPDADDEVLEKVYDEFLQLL